MRLLLILIVFLVSISITHAENEPVDTNDVADTVLFEGTRIFDDISPVTNADNYEKRMFQPPTRALFKSMFVPGWGQWGNRRHLKAVILFGLDAWFVGSAIHYGGQASDFRSKWTAADNVDDARDYYSLYLDRRDERNKFTWFAVIITFLLMFDAYVDAHLSGFPAAEGVDLSFRPEQSGTMTATLSYSF
jgi:hypothetical protein